MTKIDFYIDQLRQNKETIYALLQPTTMDLIVYKPTKKAWSLLEILCHLVDEEKEDFRLRINYLVKNVGAALTAIDPMSWVEERSYLQQNFQNKLSEWSMERDDSIVFLNTLSSTDYLKGIDHSIFGSMTAEFFLRNWVAHDFLHIRQITKNKYLYLKSLDESKLEYAGNWVI